MALTYVLARTVFLRRPACLRLECVDREHGRGLVCGIGGTAPGLLEGLVLPGLLEGY